MPFKQNKLPADRILTIQMFLFRPHYFVSRRLAYSFGDGRAGDTVLGSGYPVCNALSRHPESHQVFDHDRSRKSSRRTSLGSMDQHSKPRPDKAGDERREGDRGRRQASDQARKAGTCGPEGRRLHTHGFNQDTASVFKRDKILTW